MEDIPPTAKKEDGEEGKPKKGETEGEGEGEEKPKKARRRKPKVSRIYRPPL